MSEGAGPSTSRPRYAASSSSSPSGGAGAEGAADGGQEMDPQIWSLLEGSLLMEVFARLPLPQLFTKPVQLSKEWAKTTATTAFRRLCAKAHPDVECKVGPNKAREVVIGVIDRRARGQPEDRQYHNVLTNTMYDDTEFSVNKGLLCLVKRNDTVLDNPISIRVCNPLRDEWKTLPPIPESADKRPVFMQIEVDSSTGKYGVLVGTLPKLTRRGKAKIHTEHAYESGTGQWSTVHSRIDWEEVFPPGPPRASCGHDLFRVYVSWDNSP